MILLDAYINLEIFQESIDYCLYAVASGLIVGFTLLFLIYAISAVWYLFKSISKG